MLTLAVRPQCPHRQSKFESVVIHPTLRWRAYLSIRVSSVSSCQRMSREKEVCAESANLAISEAQMPVPHPRSRMLYGVCDWTIGLATACTYELPSFSIDAPVWFRMMPCIKWYSMSYRFLSLWTQCQLSRAVLQYCQCDIPRPSGMDMFHASMRGRACRSLHTH